MRFFSILIVFVSTLAYSQRGTTSYDTIFPNGDRAYRTNQGRIFFSPTKQTLSFDNNGDTHMAMHGIVEVSAIYKNSIIYRDTNNRCHMLSIDYLKRLDPYRSEIKTTDKPIYQILSVKWEDLGLGQLMVRGFNNRSGETAFIRPDGTIGASISKAKDENPNRTRYRDGWSFVFGSRIILRDKLGWTPSTLGEATSARLYRIADSTTSKKSQIILVNGYKSYGAIEYKKRRFFPYKWKILIHPKFDTIVFERDQNDDLNFLVSHKSRQGIYYTRLVTKEGYQNHKRPDLIIKYLDSNHLNTLMEWMIESKSNEGYNKATALADSVFYSGDYRLARKLFLKIYQQYSTEEYLSKNMKLCYELEQIDFTQKVESVQRVSDTLIGYIHHAESEKHVLFQLNNNLLPKIFRHHSEKAQLEITRIDELKYRVKIKVNPTITAGEWLGFKIPSDEEIEQTIQKNRIAYKALLDQLEITLRNK